MNNEVFLSVSEVNTYIKTIMDRDPFLSYVCIKGEISNLKFHTNGGLYFSLKDDKSKINAVMFGYQKSLNFTPKDGMNVEVRGKISTYIASGSYQIYVSSMKEDGIGNLYILFEELKKKLASEGLFDQSKKKKIPKMPKKVGVITAPTGAAVKDIISTINRRYPLCEIIVFPTLVQGDGAKDNIVRMLEVANKSDVDVIILGRGGGSIEDLWAFNEEVVARAIFASNKPIISAVGHEIDFTISDFVSDLRAPTPTGAAELAVPDKNQIIKYLYESKGRLSNALINKIKNNQERLNKIKDNYILNNPISMYEVEMQKLDNLTDKLNTTYVYNLEKYNNQIALYPDKLSNLIKTNLERIKNKLNNYNIKLDLLNPDNIINKGYSLTLKDGVIIKDIKDIKVGDTITTKVKNGEILSEVKENI